MIHPTKRQMAILIACSKPKGARWSEVCEAYNYIADYRVNDMGIGTQLCRLGGGSGTTRAKTRKVIRLIRRSGRRGNRRYSLTPLGQSVLQEHLPGGINEFDWRPESHIPEDYYA